MTKVPGPAVTFRARSRSEILEQAWVGALFEIKVTPPVWMCRHDHAERQQAHECAEAEWRKLGSPERVRVREMARPTKLGHRAVIHAPGSGEAIWLCDCQPRHESSEEARLCAESEIIRRETLAWEARRAQLEAT